MITKIYCFANEKENSLDNYFIYMPSGDSKLSEEDGFKSLGFGFFEISSERFPEKDLIKKFLSEKGMVYDETLQVLLENLNSEVEKIRKGTIQINLETPIEREDLDKMFSKYLSKEGIDYIESHTSKDGIKRKALRIINTRDKLMTGEIIQQVFKKHFGLTLDYLLLERFPKLDLRFYFKEPGESILLSELEENYPNLLEELYDLCLFLE